MASWGAGKLRCVYCIAEILHVASNCDYEQLHRPSLDQQIVFQHLSHETQKKGRTTAKKERKTTTTTTLQVCNCTCLAAYNPIAVAANTAKQMYCSTVPHRQGRKEGGRGVGGGFICSFRLYLPFKAIFAAKAP